MRTERTKSDTAVALTPQQKRMIVLHEIDSTNVAYNTGAGFRLRGFVDTERLFRAVQAVVRRHDVLRTRFALEDGVPVGWLDESPDFEWEVTGLGHDGKGSTKESILRHRLDERMDLARRALRVRLVRVANDEALLTIVMHHVVCDGWSFAVFVDEMCAEYEAAGGGSPLAKERVAQYGDYAAWLATQLKRGSYKRSVEYFSRVLAGAPQCLELPWDRPRPALQTYRGKQVARRLAPGLVAEAQGLAARQRGTPFLAFYAAYVLLLRRFSGQRDIVVGVPVANRERAEFSRSIGFFVNTLPLRTEVLDHATFLDLLDSVRTSLFDALDHGMAQIEDIIEALRLPRDASYPPLYQAMFAYQNAPAPRPSSKSIRAETVLIGTVGAKGDLTLNLDTIDETLLASWEYNEDLFDRDTIVRLAECYESLLERVLREPERAVCEVDVVPANQRESLLVRWNSERLAYPEACVGTLIREQALRTPHAPAIRWRDQTWSYAQLLGRSYEIARDLSRAGVRNGGVVGVLAERNADLVAALLAIWHVGAAYVPLDPSYPVERLGFMLQDSGASAVLVGRAGSALPIPDGVAVVELETSSRPPDVVPRGDEPREPSQPSDLAYIIYTSGSTGRPKGVCIEHRSVVAFLAWAHRAYEPEDLASVLASTSICFDLSVFELFVPLTCGGTAVLIRDALELAELPEPPPVTLINIVHSALAELMRLRAVPRSVRVVNFGGELPSNETAQQAYALGHVERAYNVYGPTEDTVYSMSFCIERGSSEVPAIGWSIPNSQAYVLDEHGKLVPFGVTGELYLAGDGLARCYHGRPDLTAERFVEIDVGRKVRAYRTGDVARRQANGKLQFLGRRDHQVKLRGYRIELGEIDQALLRCEGVREAVTVPWSDASGDKMLVAYFVTGDGGATVERIRKQLAEWVPAYMVPTHLFELPQLPLTPNGKVARERLPAPPETRGSGSGTRPDGLEPCIARVYEELLGATTVGSEDEFFALGGHSLMAARVAARLATELAVDVNIRDVFRFPRVRELATELEGRVARGATRPNVSREASTTLRESLVLGEFQGYHVNCFVHCVLQSLNYFTGRSIHELNHLSSIFLPHRYEHRELQPGDVAAATLYREIKSIPVHVMTDRMVDLFGMRTSRLRLERSLLALQTALTEGLFPILVGGTERIVEPSIALLEWNEERREFVALGNDFGVGLKTLPFDSPRLRPGEEVLLVHPPPSDGIDEAALLTRVWRAHLADRRARKAAEEQAFEAWIDKYESRRALPERPLLYIELEGVNVTIGSEISGFLRFERHVLEHLPPSLQTDQAKSHQKLIDRTLADYQHLTNVLRRALLVADDLGETAVNAKITDALKSVAEHQRGLARSLDAIE